MTIAFYPGSFDPMTNGHLDVLVQALNVVPKVVVGIGIHPGKVPMFSFEERAELIATSLERLCLCGQGMFRSSLSMVWPSMPPASTGRPCWFAACAMGQISTTKCSLRA